VIEKSTGHRVGETGFLDVHREIVPSLNGIPEIGWAFAKPAQGKGYATEAVRAALAWGEQRFGKTRFACIIAPGNAPSLNVAAKTGFREAARTTYKGEPTVMFYRDP
jgi:RimJ/RimL family protein N-acetyltransferase